MRFLKSPIHQKLITGLSELRGNSDGRNRVDRTCHSVGTTVPSHMYLAVRKNDRRLVGIIDLRNHINHPILGTWGGHCGYSVRPSERRKGYAKRFLQVNMMIIEPIEIRDKLGRTVILRTAGVEDAEELIQYLKITCGETPYLVREPEEINITKEDEEGFIQSKIDDERELMIVALIDGRYIGNCSLMSAGPNTRFRHRCEIGIALYKDYCGCGIGKAMMETVLRVAAESGYEQAELEVMDDNKRAISLYEKLGFVKYGTLPHNMKYSDGTYADAIWMMKKLI